LLTEVVANELERPDKAGEASAQPSASEIAAKRRRQARRTGVLPPATLPSLLVPSHHAGRRAFSSTRQQLTRIPYATPSRRETELAGAGLFNKHAAVPLILVHKARACARLQP